MKKVVTINLNGRAYQVEEAGYDSLKAYLGKAEKTLVDNPDKGEILSDIEQAIADKCDGELSQGKDVVSLEGVERILAAIGPVHTTQTEDKDVAEAVEANDSSRKLYRLPKDGKIAGVCAGLAAYFDTDVTIMRLLFVVLIFVTQGFMIFIYLLLIIAMPEAKKPEQVAEAHGRPGTAREILGRVKETATNRDTVQRIGDVIDTVGTVLAKVIMALSALLFGGLTLVWVWLLGAIGLGGVQMQGQLASLNGLKQAVFVTAVYVVVAVPFFIIVRMLDRVGKNENDRNNRGSNAIYGVLVALIVVATVVISAFFSVYSDSISSYIRSHSGYVDIGSHSYCLDEARCGDSVR